MGPTSARTSRVPATIAGTGVTATAGQFASATTAVVFAFTKDLAVSTEGGIPTPTVFLATFAATAVSSRSTTISAAAAVIVRAASAVHLTAASRCDASWINIGRSTFVHEEVLVAVVSKGGNTGEGANQASFCQSKSEAFAFPSATAATIATSVIATDAEVAS